MYIRKYIFMIIRYDHLPYLHIVGIAQLRNHQWLWLRLRLRRRINLFWYKQRLFCDFIKDELPKFGIWHAPAQCDTLLMITNRPSFSLALWVIRKAPQRIGVILSFQFGSIWWSQCTRLVNKVRSKAGGSSLYTHKYTAMWQMHVCIIGCKYIMVQVWFGRQPWSWCRRLTPWQGLTKSSTVTTTFMHIAWMLLASMIRLWPSQMQHCQYLKCNI